MAGNSTFDAEDFTLTIDISDEGEVEVSAPGETESFSCELVSDEICNLDVLCTEDDGNDTFRFTLTRNE